MHRARLHGRSWSAGREGLGGERYRGFVTVTTDYREETGYGGTELSRQLRSMSTQLTPQLVSWRRHLHVIPELAFQEAETAAFVAKTLREIGGYDVREHVGGTGVVADLRIGNSPRILLRADMDALPVTELRRVSWRSHNEGVMHACGHDGHMSMLLGAASILADLVHQGRKNVNVRLLFQPAEEASGPNGEGGARSTIDDGVLDGVEAALALHLEPGHDLGVINFGSGYVMGSVDVFTGVIRGRGGHAARPEETVDPFWLLTPVLSAIQGIVSRRISPLESALVSLCHLTGGDISNVIPAEVVLEGTMRSFKPDIRARLHDELRAAFGIAQTLGGEVELSIQEESPPLYNDPDVYVNVMGAVRALDIAELTHEGPYGLIGEDFSEIAARVPAAMVMLGCAPSSGPRSLHSPDFDIDERVLERGAALLALGSLALGRVRRHQQSG
ncbi:M20 family metallopeptidase [Ferrimicrobium sp.]|uniref:M20 metallopeptidase family protein n=1 Tax=Ferrimicrobium sp. TaxID=2926050 RepID=UPI00262627BC|nr:M20 family metallopeptidase [Ferrimicrobium sp.]